jgi:hypothetical protein
VVEVGGFAAAIEVVVDEERPAVAAVEVGAPDLTVEVVVDVADPLIPGKKIAHAATAAAITTMTTIKIKPRRRACFRRRRSLRELGVRYRPGSGVIILLGEIERNPL